MAYGPAAGLEIVDALAPSRRSRAITCCRAVRGDLLARLGRHDEARTAFAQAAALTRNVRERTLLTARAEESGRNAEDAARPAIRPPA